MTENLIVNQFTNSMLFKLSKNWAIYTGMSFLSCLATIIPVTRFGVFLILMAYLLYGITNMKVVQTEIEKKGVGKDEDAKKWALSYSAADFLFWAIAIIVGVYLGVR